MSELIFLEKTHATNIYVACEQQSYFRWSLATNGVALNKYSVKSAKINKRSLPVSVGAFFHRLRYIPLIVAIFYRL